MPWTATVACQNRPHQPSRRTRLLPPMAVSSITSNSESSATFDERMTRQREASPRCAQIGALASARLDGRRFRRISASAARLAVILRSELSRSEANRVRQPASHPATGHHDEPHRVKVNIAQYGLRSDQPSCLAI